MKNYKVYAIKERNTDTIVYVGLTSKTLHKRFMQHVQQKKIDTKLYYISLIQENLNILEAATLERMLIEQYDLVNKGWNKSKGSVNGNSQLHSEYQKAKWSKERKGKPFKGRQNRTSPNTEEHNRKISEANSKPIICLTTGKHYPSIRAAAQDLGLSEGKISLVCQGKRNATGQRGSKLKYKFSYL